MSRIHNIFLCHKCGGVLRSEGTTTDNPLYSCGCISGWVRDWQTPVSYPEAVLQQAVNAEQALKWAEGQQDADPGMLRVYRDRLRRMERELDVVSS